jgi:hypothetical protein
LSDIFPGYKIVDWQMWDAAWNCVFFSLVQSKKQSIDIPILLCGFYMKANAEYVCLSERKNPIWKILVRITYLTGA